MSNSFEMTILTPDKCFFSGKANEVVFGTPNGRMGVMAGHMAMVVAVVEGTIDILEGEEWTTAAVSQGFVEIKGDIIEFFVDTVEWSTEIDVVRAKEALERAEMRLKAGLSRVEYVRTQAAMARALARIKAVETTKKAKP